MAIDKYQQKRDTEWMRKEMLALNFKIRRFLIKLDKEHNISDADKKEIKRELLTNINTL